MFRAPSLELLPILFQRACQRKAPRANSGQPGVEGILIGTNVPWEARARVGLRRTLPACIIACGLAASALAQQQQTPTTAPTTPAATPEKPAESPAPGAPTTQPPTNPTQPGSETVLQTLPDASAVLAASNQLADWIKAWKAPAEKPEGLPTTPAATVTLRLLGEIVGRGQDMTGDDSTIWRAATKALAEATKRLPFDNDALSDQRKREVSGSISISLEVAGVPVPLHADTYDDVDAMVPIGLSGVAGRLGERVEYVFPAGMLASATSPGDTAAGVVGRLLRDPAKGIRIDETAQPKAVASQGVKLYRFDVLHVYKTSPGDGGRFLYRGGRVVEQSTITATSLREFADGLATNLTARRWPGKERFGVRGAYDPVRNVHEPAIAPPPEQALIALALRRYGSLGEGEPFKTARQAADAVIADLASVTEGEEAPWATPRGAALFIAALAEGSKSRLDNPEFTEAVSVLPALERCIVVVNGEQQREAVLRALALACGGTRGDTAAGRGAAGMILSSILTADAGSQATAMPWLFFADRAASGGSVDPLHAPAYRTFRDQAYNVMLSQADAGDDGRDLVGGFVFAAPGKASLPSSQSARVAAALAAMLNDESVTPPADRTKELVRLLPVLRFLRQLAADETTAPLLKDSPRSRWGIRSAFWDPRMPGEATALTLLAVCETLDAIKAMTPATPASAPK